ncbi:xanthine dehydrogenase accessory protein XdhC [Seohaeicola saemankumensis]|uniref:Xanthine dehydrogenase accessory protein XdhC n=1 Tax=Seohaeicola saemankumensis TaxID=481181 RepID=A0ABW3THG5_9RHOB
MGFDLAELTTAVTGHGRVARVVIAQVRGSSPREVGAAMLVWPEGQSGTIGGGALEHQAAQAARAMLAGGPASRLSRHALGPDLGQCCGGSVQLLSEVYDAVALEVLEGHEVIARPVTQGTQGTQTPLAVQRLLHRARAQGQRPAPQLIEGWMVESLARASVPLWIWGAGHVGRALVATLSPLPDLAITWVDTHPERFPAQNPWGVTILPAAEPARLVPHAPKDAHHLILTYSHALDLALCHGLLEHGFASAGLIGSATKWARFRSRLQALGHACAHIARIRCPIGAPTLGKHPQAIAIGVAASLMNGLAAETDRKERSA